MRLIQTNRILEKFWAPPSSYGAPLRNSGYSGHNKSMTANQEEALYDFLDDTVRVFDLDSVVTHVKKIESKRANHLASEIEAFIKIRNMAFPAGDKRWISRRGCFEPLTFVINPTRLELVNGILIPGHRCLPFANAGLMPQEYIFFWQGSMVPFTTTEGPPEDFYPYYSIFGEEYAPQYVARDNSENEAAFNSDPYDDPPEVSVKTLDMRNIYREASFVPGDKFAVSSLDWKTGIFNLRKVNKDEWSAEDLLSWQKAAEEGFEKSFNDLGPCSCTEEQIAFAYWLGGSRMREIPAYSLEEFLYEKTDRIEITAYGIESRFWYAGREIPDRRDLDSGNTRPDKTIIEKILHTVKIPVSEYVVQSYIRDSLFRGDENEMLIMHRLIPACVEMDVHDRIILAEYTKSILAEFRETYNPFTNKIMGSIRSRMAELHTAVVDLAIQLSKGDIDLTWLPRHTFIILSQIQGHTAAVLEDLDSDEPPPEAEMEAMDGSLESMLETYEDIKELIDSALDSFRRNKLAVIRAGSSQSTETEWLIQLSISGVDIWRRLIVNENCSLRELHQIIQTVFKWNNSQPYVFRVDRLPESAETIDPDIRIKALEIQNTVELLYEYGTNWAVRIMILSRYESTGNKHVRCVAGAGAAPPEFINGSLRFRRMLSALESGNNIERLGARQELGQDYVAGDFDIEDCNRSLSTVFLIKRYNEKR